MYPYKLTKHYENKNQKVIRTEQEIVFILARKLLQRVELRDKINVTEHNRLITRKIMFPLSLRKTCGLANCILFLVQYDDY